MSGAICNPLCVKHDAPRPCPICDPEWFDEVYGSEEEAE